MIAYQLLKVKFAENNYTANDRALYALVSGLPEFRCYLEESTFSVITDNQVVSSFVFEGSLNRRKALVETASSFQHIISAGLQLQVGRGVLMCWEKRRLEYDSM